VTVALCGHWEHDGPCRWPHNSRIDADVAPARFRTVVIVDDATATEVIARIEAKLRADDRWRVVDASTAAIAPGEEGLARSLLRTPPSV
jgi:hypothetical protein